MANTTTYPVSGDKTPAAQAQRETHWRRVLDRCGKSGLTRTAFCSRESINESSLSWWARVLRERDETRRPKTATKPRRRKRTRSHFVPVRVIEAVPAVNATPVEVVARGGRVVRVQPGFDVPTLRRVIAALEDLSC